MEMRQIQKTFLATFITISLAQQVWAENIEVLHRWQSGGESVAVNQLKNILEKQGHVWTDARVSGTPEQVMATLKKRSLAGNPPSAAQVKGPNIQDWAKMDLLTNLDDVASSEGWNDILPPVVTSLMRYTDHSSHYVAVPVNVHRVNWLWANANIFRQVGVEVPTTWEEFFMVAEKIKKAGFIPLAHGAQAWQDATLFEDMVLGLGGPKFYKKTLVDLNRKALKSDKMIEILEKFKKLKDYTDDKTAGRGWDEATKMVINDQAAMQIMGDWVKGEFSAAHKTLGQDYFCVPSPGTKDSFIFNVDSLVMFENQDKQVTQATKDLAKVILEPEFQRVFNLNKGSIPVRMDMDMSMFDDCAKLSASDFKKASDSKALVPSMAHEMAVPSAVRQVFLGIISDYLHSENMTAKEAAERLAKEPIMAF